MEAEEALLRQLCATPLLLCSPLTRALQTCLIGLDPLLSQMVHLKPAADVHRPSHPGSKRPSGAQRTLDGLTPTQAYTARMAGTRSGA